MPVTMDLDDDCGGSPVATENQSLTKDMVAVARERLHHLRAHQPSELIQQAELLALLEDAGCYGDHHTFRDVCEKDFDIPHQVARQMVRVSNWLALLSVDPDDAARLGPGELRLLAKHIAPDELNGEWIVKAMGMTFPELEAHLKECSEHPLIGNATTKRVFYLHRDQAEVVQEAVGRIKEESGTKHDAVALEYICQSYLGFPPMVVSRAQVVETLASFGLDFAYGVFAEAFPGQELKVTPSAAEQENTTGDVGNANTC